MSDATHLPAADFEPQDAPPKPLLLVGAGLAAGILAVLGVSLALVSLAYGGFIVLRTLIHGIDVPGYASLLVGTLFLGGIQLVGIGVIGEYVGRIYYEAKGRPLYLVRRRYPSSAKVSQLPSRAPLHPSSPRMPTARKPFGARLKAGQSSASRARRVVAR